MAISMVDSSNDSENENEESDGGSGESENADDSSEEIEELLPLVQTLVLERQSNLIVCQVL